MLKGKNACNENNDMIDILVWQRAGNIKACIQSITLSVTPPYSVHIMICGVCSDMMPALHNYVTQLYAFLANPQHMEMIFDMCKSVSTTAGSFTRFALTPLVQVLQ